MVAVMYSLMLYASGRECRGHGLGTTTRYAVMNTLIPSRFIFPFLQTRSPQLISRSDSFRFGHVFCIYFRVILIDSKPLPAIIFVRLRCLHVFVQTLFILSPTHFGATHVQSPVLALLSAFLAWSANNTYLVLP